MLPIQNKSYTKKVRVNKYIFHFELSSNPNVDKLGITISMWKYDFETILTYNYFMNIQDGIVNEFGSI